VLTQLAQVEGYELPRRVRGPQAHRQQEQIEHAQAAVAETPQLLGRPAS
jgi:hypothetical protein